ncbi:transposase family protein [Amycolatopsis echigonensis]|uniref:Transposase family protein n=2 Tax=Amycolatopsis echigonensis TaxID=2576905 RepID=A0A8E1VXP0_9PSEU|nr:transposase family protein [Amycolatopsis echigonensis]
MVAEYNNGASQTEIANKYGLSLSWTGRLLRQAGAQLPPIRQGVKRTDLKHAVIVRQYLVTEASIRKIAAYHGTSYGTIRRILQRHGVVLRPHGGANRRVRR